MSSELRRAAQAVVHHWKHGKEPTTPELILRLEAALSAPDDLAEAREIIRRLLNFKDIHRDHSLVECAREFLKRTGGE